MSSLEELKLKKHNYYMQKKVKDENWPYCTLCGTKLRIWTSNWDWNARRMHASCDKSQKEYIRISLKE